MSLSALTDPAFSSRLCVTLLHSLWQVALVTIVAVLVARTWRKPSAARSYTVHWTALMIALVALPVTWLVVDASGAKNIGHSASTDATSPEVPSWTAAQAMMPAEVPEVTVEPVIIFSQQLPDLQKAETPNPASAFSPTVAVATASADWQKYTKWIAVLYVIGVISMLSRLAVAMRKAHQLAESARPIHNEALLSVVRRLATTWSMKVVPVLSEAERIFVPQVVGLLRPTILLPAAAINGLSVDELEMILAHEVAHIRRYDMWAALIQRLAESLLFFNPAIWYLNRRISELREYCCDDIACQAQTIVDPPPHVRYAHALLRVVELGQPNAVGSPHLTTLAASGRSPSELRRRVTRLFGEPMREPLRLSRGGFLTCLAVAALLLVGPVFLPTGSRENSITAANPEPDESRKPNSDATSTSAKKQEDDSTREFQLDVVGPSGSPVANAVVSIRSNKPIESEQIRRGTFDRKHSYGAYVKTNELGQLTVAWERSSGYVVFAIEQPGYGPYWAQWNSDDLPEKHTAELDAAWSVGGIVVDENGQPIAGAEVSPSVEFKKPPGDTSHLGGGASVKTDADGKWRYDLVPVLTEKDYVHISIDHPNHQPQRLPLPRSEFEVRGDASPSRTIVLKAGVKITGKVIDNSGNPIEGATVRTKFVNEVREAKTDAAGTYAIGGGEPRLTRIVAFAKGHAMELQEVLVDPRMKPVDFTLKPGGHVRIRVVDENGKGLAKARIFFQRWRGHIDYSEFRHVNQYADENGVWEWNEAPLDEFQADICHPDGMQLSSRPILASAEEYVFSPPPLLVVSGSVIDAKTRMPIPSFRVVSGLRDAPGLNSGEYWNRREAEQFTSGKYRVTNSREALAHMWRIEAEGYKNAVTRDIKMDEGSITIDFELQPAADIQATILTPEGKAAAEADIAIGVARDRITIRNGKIREQETRATRLKADPDGRFRIPDPDVPFQIVIMHADGYAHVKSIDGPIPETITLNAWARAEGSFRVGIQLVPDVPIGIHGAGLSSYDRENGPDVSIQTIGTTDSAGQYRFDRIVPGFYRIGREITFMVRDGATEVTSSQRVAVEYVAGKTTTLDLGGTGRAVTGKLVPPDDFSDVVLWSNGRITVTPDLPQPTIPKSAPFDEESPDQEAKVTAWLATDEGKAYLAAHRAYQIECETYPETTATIARDGSFRIDDLPAGKYVLSLYLERNPSLSLPEYRFTVPTVDQDADPEPVSLGNLLLEKR